MAFGSNIITWFNGQWHEGNTPILGAADHATWLGTLVFDGARAFEGVAPDLDLHCARLIRSAKAMGLMPAITTDDILSIAQQGIARYAPDAELYIRPMMWSLEGAGGMIAPDPHSCAFALCIEDLAMPAPTGLKLCLSSFRRPRPDTALTEAKAACLYPNNGRMVAEARQKGFDNAISLDMDGNVAETASTNVFLVRDGAVQTPQPNGTFLNGITRQRVISLLRADGTTVLETTIQPEELLHADEIFLTGNAAKVMPVIQYEDRVFQPGPIAARARELYWDYALQTGKSC